MRKDVIMEKNTTEVKQKTLKDFLEFMKPNRYGAGWTMTSNTPSHIVFEKTYKAEGGSCLIALILLLLGLLPGILYLIFARKPARTVKLAIMIAEDGTLHPSGDSEGINKFKQFTGANLKPREGGTNITTNGISAFLGTRPGKWAVGIAILFVLYLLGVWLGK